MNANDKDLENISKNIQFIEEHSFMYQIDDIAAKYACAVTNLDNVFYLFWFIYTDGIHVKYIKSFKPNFLMKYKTSFNIFVKYHKRRFIYELNLINSITKRTKEFKWN